MDFRTELHVSPSKYKIAISNKVLAVGSCFADEIGMRLAENKFQVGNYFGTVYNPISIHRLLTFGLKNEFPSNESYAANEEVYFNYHFHSSFNSLNKEEIENRIQKTITDANSFLKSANEIIITYGTSFVYQLKENNLIVANCHKMPSVNFSKALLTESEIVESFQEFYSILKKINPGCKIILTVSPVRHLKDTLELNSVSKSILRMACHSITKQFEDVAYFPAYEILLDDLRDYRFYKSDQIHPTEEAVDYIWQKFVNAYFDEPTKKFLDDWNGIKKELNHRPFNPHSASHQKFLKTLLVKLESLRNQTDVTNEIATIKSQILK